MSKIVIVVPTGRDRCGPDVAAGDLLAILDVGAYGYSMSSHFLNRPRPAEVMVTGERCG